MPSGPFRAAIRNARRVLHDYMKVGAFYYRLNGDGTVVGPIIEITARVHDKFLRIGDLAGTNFNYAEVEENSPRAVFMLSEIVPSRGYYISTQEGVYKLDSSQPKDDISVIFNLVRLSEKEAEKQGHPVYDESVTRLYMAASLPRFA